MFLGTVNRTKTRLGSRWKWFPTRVLRWVVWNLSWAQREFELILALPRAFCPSRMQNSLHRQTWCSSGESYLARCYLPGHQPGKVTASDQTVQPCYRWCGAYTAVLDGISLFTACILVWLRKCHGALFLMSGVLSKAAVGSTDTYHSSINRCIFRFNCWPRLIRRLRRHQAALPSTDWNSWTRKARPHRPGSGPNRDVSSPPTNRWLVAATKSRSVSVSGNVSKILFKHYTIILKLLLKQKQATFRK